mmetsp:Transcript_115574/g.331774  ORF Transcript_115574/g.331774 Transcript_115574/m.331774 type:complete len:230 (+) Transcript_115574:380-1069(+)
MTHQSRLGYVSPHRMTKRSHAFRKTGRQRKCTSMLFWSMPLLSNHTHGSRLWCNLNSARQRCKAFHFASGSSCHEWERNASHWPRRTCSDRPRTKSRSGVLLRKTSRLSRSKGTARKRRFDCDTAEDGVMSPMRQAMLAAPRTPAKVPIQRRIRACNAMRVFRAYTNHNSNIVGGKSFCSHSTTTMPVDSRISPTANRATVNHIRACTFEALCDNMAQTAHTTTEIPRA